MKRILSWVLALVMIISLLPAVTVLNVQAATTSLAVYLWDKTVTVDNDDTTADKLEAYYYLNNGTSAPTECTANDNWNYSYAIIDGIPTLTLRNAEYNFNSEPLIEKTSNSSFTLNIVYEGTNNITRTGGEVIKMPAGSKVYYPTINIIGKEGAVLNITGGGKSSHVVDFAAKAASADDGAKVKFIGGTVNITKGVTESYSGNLYLAQCSLILDNCNMTLTNQVTNESMYQAALTVSGTYKNERNLTVKNSDLTINTNGPLGILASGNKWGAYTLAKQNVTIEGDSNVSITVTDSVCTSDDYLRAGINANNLYLKDSATLEVKTSSAKIETIQAIVLNEGTAPDLSGYQGKYNMYTTEGSVAANEYTATSYFKLEPVKCIHPNADPQTNCLEAVMCPDCEGVAIPAKEEHSKPRKIPGTEPNCTTGGLSDGWVCDDCGTVITEQTPLDPQHTPVEGQKATCTTGVPCQFCEELAIKPLGHSLKQKCVENTRTESGGKWAYEKIPTCTESGLKAYKYCLRADCDQVFSINESNNNTTKTGFANLAAYEESLGANGRYAAPFGHEFVADETVETGHKCKYCDEIAHDLKVEMVEGDAVNHKLVCKSEICEYFVEEAHDFSEGNCACGYEKPAEPECTHENKKVVGQVAPTCGKDGYTGDTVCADCNAPISTGTVDPKTGNHAYGDWTDGKKTCSVCQDVVTCTHETELKNFVAATCGKDGYSGDLVCKICSFVETKGQVVTATGDHKYGEWVDGKQTCSVCQAVVECKHESTKTVDAKEATCGEAGYTGDTVCNTCGETTVKGEAILATGNHAGGEATCKELAVCDTCGKTYGELAEHKFEEGYCSVCDKKDETAKFVAEVNGKEYTSLQTAINEAAENATIKLIGTVELTGDDGVEFNKTLTLALNGQTITSTGDAIVVTAGVLTIEGKGNVIAATDNAGSSCAVWANGGKVIIMDGTYTTGGDTTTTDVDHQNDSIYTKNGGSVEIYGGTFKYTENVWTLNERDDNRGTIKVYGGEFEKFDPANNNSEGANTNFLGNQAQHTKAVEGVYTICDGKAQAAVEENKNPATYDAPGSYDLVVYCECDKELSRETNTIPQLTGAVAEVGGKKFGTLAAAIEAATEGQTITLIGTVELTGDDGVEFNKTLTLDLNGQTITSTGDAIVVTAGTLTIEGKGNVIAATDNAGSSCAVWANGGKVIIKDGTYTTYGDTTTTDVDHQNDSIYTKNGGSVEIYGGIFKYVENVWTLNERDDNRGTIKVYGGEFEKFDPAKSVAQASGDPSFVAEGEHTKKNGEYFVICDGKAQAAVEENKKSATCTENGSYDLVVYCECSKELSRETKTIVSEGHDYTSDTTPATCTVDGKIVYTCTCGDSYEEPIIAQGHKFNVTLETVDPTVSAPGYVVYKCENCEETKTEEAGAQLSKPTLALNGSVVTITDADNIFVQLGVAFVGDKTVNVTKWNEFTALGGKALDGKNGYSNLGEAKTATLTDNGNYVFYVVYKNGEVNEMFYQLFTVTEANGAPSFAINGNKAELNANGNAIIQSGVKFVGTISDEAAAQIIDWTHFAALTGKALDGKNGYTNLGLKSEATLTESGDYIFYVIYDDINGARRTVFFKMSANVENDKPVIELDEGKAILNSNGREIIQSGVKFVEEISEEDFANIHEWGDFSALVGTALDNKKGYTNLGTKTEATLSKAGDYVYYVIYTDVAGNVKTMFTVVTVE